MPVIDVPTVHAVTDDAVLANSGFVAHASALLRVLGSAVAVHLRGRDTPAARLLALAERLAPLQAETDGWIVVNDRADVAAAAVARAVQLRRGSLSIEDVRRVSARLVCGVSVHEVNEASAALAAGARWVIAGNVFETPSHPDRVGRGEAFVRDIAATGACVIAIGGITPERAASVRAAGAHGVAAIRGIWYAADPVLAARAYL